MSSFDYQVHIEESADFDNYQEMLALIASGEY